MKAPKREMRTEKANAPMPPDVGAGQTDGVTAQNCVRVREELAAIRARLFREPAGHSWPAVVERVTLEGLVLRLSTDAACLVGALRTVASRLG